MKKLHLLLLHIIVLWYSCAAEDTETLRCTGLESTFTYDDCQGDTFNSSGCYFLEHFMQYRPCNKICDGVLVGSIDEMRCRYFCPGGWLEKFSVVSISQIMVLVVVVAITTTICVTFTIALCKIIRSASELNKDTAVITTIAAQATEDNDNAEHLPPEQEIYAEEVDNDNID